MHKNSSKPVDTVPGATAVLVPFAVLLTYGAKYHTVADDTVVTLAMIETAKSLTHLDDILSINALNGIFSVPMI